MCTGRGPVVLFGLVPLGFRVQGLGFRAQGT